MKNVVNKNTEVDVLPVVDLFEESAKKKKRLWAMHHRCLSGLR